ncbi:putative aldehyde dehydrogenase [Patellaria atrata CBS 101060]|uniref:aldehyde dehydrogenase (NAD(+)) n=1 Tax=Patellaria atrata CBS 101060 TaxID=1346257 RepID=A0A9P4SER0_9PEZI|nr:putative aldehyde dehydrogenase [Patellaria atrata CBS 101060]
MTTNGTSDGYKPFETKLWINNEFVEAKSGKFLTIYNPHDTSLVTNKVHVAGPEDVDAAVDAAEAAFKAGPWSSFSGAQRAALMLKFADLADAKAEDLGYLETIAMGAPIMVAASIVGFLTGVFRYYAGWADKIAGETYPADDGLYKIVRYEPLGVTASIGAWNASYMLFGWKVAAALAAGNTVIYKPSEKAPLGVLALGPLFKEAGFPPGVVNVLNGGGETGHLLASHMRIAKVSFTGSLFSGKKVQEAATKSNLKRCTLELGGKSPSLIFNDADIENALNNTSNGFFVLSGQVCVAGSRVYVEEGIADKFIEALKARYEAVGSTLGASTLEPTTFMGPLADKAQFERVMEFIESGKKEAELVAGGNRVGEKGYHVQPTIFLNAKSDARIYKEEIFGPVVHIKTFKTEEEAIALANDTSYGLSATIYTSNLTRALRVSAKLETGTVAINSTWFPSNQTPFGGSKQSGLGRESGKAGLLAYLEAKTIHVNMNVD